MKTEEETQGRFVWHELMTREPANARAFYSELMNWSVDEMDMGEHGKYARLMRDKTGIGGIMPLEGAPSAIPDHWINYLSVNDVDEACTRVEALGGSVCIAAFDIVGVGRTAIVEDPNGAVFHLYKAVESKAPQTTRPAAGEFCWYDCLSADVDKAKAFYGELFGWIFRKQTFEGAGEMWVASLDGAECASIVQKPADMPRSCWLNYLLVDDLEASSARAKELGASLSTEPTELPEIGRFIRLQDPAGAQVLLFEGAAQA